MRPSGQNALASSRVKDDAGTDLPVDLEGAAHGTRTRGPDIHEHRRRSSLRPSHSRRLLTREFASAVQTTRAHNRRFAGLAHRHPAALELANQFNPGRATYSPRNRRSLRQPGVRRKCGSRGSDGD